MNKKYVVESTSEERKRLRELVKKGKVAGYKIRHGQMLLKADQGKYGPKWSDVAIVESFGGHKTTVERLRQRFVLQGLKAALERQKRSSREGKFDGEAEARLIALACSEAPEGRSEWSLRLLADKLIQLGVVDSCCHMTVQRTLKKTNLSRG